MEVVVILAREASMGILFTGLASSREHSSIMFREDCCEHHVQVLLLSVSLVDLLTL